MPAMAASVQPSWLSSTLFISQTPQRPPLFTTPFKVPSSSMNPPGSSPESSEPASPPADPVKLAFERARAYKKSSSQMKPEVEVEQAPLGNPSDGDGRDGSADRGAKTAMEKARLYVKESDANAGSERKNGEEFGIENLEERTKKEQQLVVSSIDFMGLDFADKKSTRGLPPGLLPPSDPFPEGDIPEVEIIVGDTSKFQDAKASVPAAAPVEEENQDVYKPKVKSWGVFPRPSNISKTFGGGRTIRPGDVLETAEEKAAKEARTRELLAAYKKKMGLNIDVKLRTECEKALKDGDSLMDGGKLKEALPLYEQIMKKLPFENELHGLAALQWSICQDSLTRRDKARIVYEKLQSHPSAKVSKRARQFMFSFQAMEMMKVRSSKPSAESTGYQNYFEAFVKDKSNYPLDDEGEIEEGSFSQAFPYIVFLLSPIFIVLLIAVQRRA